MKWQGDVAQRVLVYTACAAIGTAWIHLTSRASEEDVKANAEEIEEVRKEVSQRLGRVETNGIKVCQFLDRQDKLAGGPGLDCKDPD